MRVVHYSPVYHTIFRENELAFFNTHPVFRNCQNTLYGVDQLSKKLTTVLVTKIKQELVSDLHTTALEFCI